MPASQQPASLRNMSPSKSPAMNAIPIPAHGSQGGLSEGGEDGTFSLTRPESFPHMSSASTDGGGSAQSMAAFQDEPGESDDESGDSGDDEDLRSAYEEQLAVLAQAKPPERSRPRAGRGGLAALVSAAASGVDAQWKVVSAATAELKVHWAAAEALQAPQQAAPQQAALVPVDSDKHLKAVLAAAVPVLRAHWAAPQAVPKAYTAAEDQHLKAVVDRAVTEIKAHWAAAEAPAPEATPSRKQILSSEKDFAAVVSVLVAQAQEHWAIEESR